MELTGVTLDDIDIGEKWMNGVYCIVLSSGRASLLLHALRTKLGAPQLGLFSTALFIVAGAKFKSSHQLYDL